jgi:hypothetical protein
LTLLFIGWMLGYVITDSEFEIAARRRSRWAVTAYDWQCFGLYLFTSGVLVLIAVQPDAETGDVFLGAIGILLLTLIVGVAVARISHRPMWRGFSFGVRPVREWLPGLPIALVWISVYYFTSFVWNLQGTAAGVAAGIIWFMSAMLLGDLVGRAIVPRPVPSRTESASA